MEYTVKQLAELSGVTPRTLRWYDQTELLKPGRTTGAGYRLYGTAEVDRLQQILFYRELGLELSEIRSILDDPGFNRQAALQSHLSALNKRREQLDALILTVTKTIESEKGERIMTDQEKFENFQQEKIAENEKAYGSEIRQKYGDEAVDASNKRFAGLTQEQYANMEALGADILRRLEGAVQAGEDPAGAMGREIAALHREWLSYTWPGYSPEAHRGLAESYVADPRFTAYYDKNTSGCAAFLRDAVAGYTKGI